MASREVSMVEQTDDAPDKEKVRRSASAHGKKKIKDKNSSESEAIAPGEVPSVPDDPETQIYSTYVGEHGEQSSKKSVPEKSQSRPQSRGDNVDEEEQVYAPPSRDDVLPDLHRLMATIDGANEELQAQHQPPSLFTRPENVTSYQNISELKMELEGSDVDDYVGRFDQGVQDDVLMIGSISLEEVQEEEKRLRDEHIQYQEQEARIVRERQRQIQLKEEKAKKQVAIDLKDKRLLIKRKEDIQQQHERLMMDRLSKSFQRSENQLISALEIRKGEIQTMYGDLKQAAGHYGGSQGRRWKVDWNRTPQPIQVKIGCLRGIRDKLPGGRYVVMVSLHNRLGGHVMRWSNLKGQYWGGASLPTTHDGNFYNTEIKVQQSVFTVLPSKPDIRPGMVLMFELFLLRGDVVATDRVVAWGSFPVSNAEFDVIEGKFKCPLLRGEIDTLVDKHEKIESLMTSDLDHWMCNMYFEIVKLPRYLSGQKEYEVELQFSSGLLAYPERVHTGEECRDGEDPIPGSVIDLQDSPSGSQQLTGSHMGGSSLLGDDSRSVMADDDSQESVRKPPISYGKLELINNKEQPTDLRKRKPDGKHSSSEALKKKMAMADDSDSTDYDEDDVYMMKNEEGMYPVKGQPGMYYKKYKKNHVDTYHKQLYTLMPKTPLLSNKPKKRRMTTLEKLEEHKFSVHHSTMGKGKLPQQSWEKVNYVRRQMMSELGLREWRSREFWGMIIMFCLGFFCRLYLHYLTQWVFLQALDIPVNKLAFLSYTVNLNYQNTLLSTQEEIIMVLLGPFGVIFIFTCLVIISWILQKLIGSLPDVGSKFIIVFGIHSFLDPFLILVVDCIIKRYKNLGGDNPIADAAKLYWHFDEAQGSGLAGIFITVVIYACTCFTAGSIIYMYFLRLHNNGRMLDIYWRLYEDEEAFFLPHDLEMSNQELSYICRRSEQWRGEEGERRKVAVYDYIWEEETVEATVWDENGRGKQETVGGKHEVTTHVAVHTLHLDGLRELYRHFLRLPDGAIVEVFGDISAAGLDKDISKAVVQESKLLERMTGSRLSLNKIGGSGTGRMNDGFDMDDDEDMPLESKA